MSIKINLNKPLTQEERDFLEARGVWGLLRLQENEAHLRMQKYYAAKERGEDPDAEEGTEEGPDDQGDSEDLTDAERADRLAKAEEWIANAKVPQLKERLAEWELPTDGKQDELRERLLAAVRESFAPRS